MVEGSSDNLGHLLSELRRIELKLDQQVQQLRQAESEPDTHFRGLYISEREVDAIVDHPFPTPTNAVADWVPETAASRQPEDVIARLRRLQQFFNLSDFDVDVLLICLLPELDLRYQKLFGYLQDDITKKSPTINLVTSLLCGSFESQLQARQAFTPEAPLTRYQLLHLHEEPNYRPSPLLAKSLQVDERIINYLLGQDRLDRRLMPVAHLTSVGALSAKPVLPEDTGQRLEQLATQFNGTPLIVQFLGSEGVGRKTTAEYVCQQAGIPLLVADAARMADTETPPELLLALLFREGKLLNAALYFDHSDTLLPDNETTGAGYHTFTTELAGYPHWVFLAGERRWQPEEKVFQKPFFYIELPDPPYQTRRELWARYGNHDTPLAADVDLADIAGRFHLSGGQIESAVAAARSLALWRDPSDGTVTSQDIYAACRQQSGHRLGSLAYKITPKYGWDDIILPSDQITELHEICGHVKYRPIVYGDWGFEKKLSRGKGLNVLFAGPSGTGKTMAAEIMANELGLDLYRIDLAGIVSKYIGETEKNLDRIFQEGKTANAILFFDEADALFGKRSEVRDSHDRYANIEVAYLLQKMEEYDGMVILATNLRKNMDEAFARRMQFAIEFPIPEEADRRRIWQGVFPIGAPLVPEADLDFMARQFRITGGNIKNIALAAAFLAAEEGSRITMDKLIRATKREYQKMGKLCTETEFAQYFEMVRS